MLKMNKLFIGSNLFLIDFIGASIAALMLGLVVPALNLYINMPLTALYWLAIFAVFFAVYSLACYLLKPENWTSFLKLIAFLNLSYCLAILVLVFIHSDQLTLIGFIYFSFDILIVGSLALKELKAAKN